MSASWRVLVHHSHALCLLVQHQENAAKCGLFDSSFQSLKSINSLHVGIMRKDDSKRLTPLPFKGLFSKQTPVVIVLVLLLMPLANSTKIIMFTSQWINVPAVFQTSGMRVGNFAAIHYELVELGDSWLPVLEVELVPDERRRAELVAVVSCFFVCSCMMRA